jgi:hypothetical protein
MVKLALLIWYYWFVGVKCSGEEERYSALYWPTLLQRHSHWAQTGWINVVSMSFQWNYVEPMWNRHWIDVCAQWVVSPCCAVLWSLFSWLWPLVYARSPLCLWETVSQGNSLHTSDAGHSPLHTVEFTESPFKLSALVGKVACPQAFQHKCCIPVN